MYALFGALFLSLCLILRKHGKHQTVLAVSLACSLVFSFLFTHWFNNIVYPTPEVTYKISEYGYPECWYHMTPLLLQCHYFLSPPCTYSGWTKKYTHLKIYMREYYNIWQKYI